ncbi:MAG: PEP-CTERM sorting domain-containing protein [Planctomycetota bacterium]
MPRPAMLTGLAAAAVATPAFAQTGPLIDTFTSPIFTLSDPNGFNEDLGFKLVFDSDDPINNDSIDLFDNLIIESSDVGDVFTTSLATDNDFDNAVDFLNGTSNSDGDSFVFEFIFTGALGSSPITYPAGLLGQQIETIELEFEIIDFETPGDTPGSLTDVELAFDLRFFAPVPEPASAALLALACPLVSRRRRRR